MSARHLEAPRAPGEGLDSHKALCGLAVGRDRLVSHAAETTCRLCLRKNTSDRRGEYKRLLLEHAQEHDELAPEPEPFTPGPTPYAGRGAAFLSYLGARAIERSKRGDSLDTRGTFPSVNAAVRALAAYLDEGASLSSSSSPSRFEGTSKGSRHGVVSNVERQVDRVVGVRKALEAAFREGMSFGPVHLPPSICLDVYTWRHAGKPYHTSKRRDCVQRADVDTDWIAAQVQRLTGHAITVHQIALVIRAGNAALASFLDGAKQAA